MTIVVSKNNKNAKRLEESNFRIESDLQKYIYDNPDVVPIYDINQDAQLFIAAREFPTNSGPIDALGFDESGNIYVIETKLFKNQDKRTVVAQALDYGASLWRYSTDFDVFVDKLNSHTIKQFSKSFEKSFCEFFGLDDFSQASDAIHHNLENGIIKFVILMDKLDDRLKDLIVYVNQNSKFDIYAVDFEYYKHDQFEIVIPKLYGAEVKKTVTTSHGSPTRRKWSKEEFFEVVDNNRQLVSPEQKEAVYKLWNWSEARGASFNWGTAKIYGTFSPVFPGRFNRSFFTVSIDGYTAISYKRLDRQPDEARRLRDILKRILGDKQPKLTDIPDDRLLSTSSAIIAKDTPKFVDLIIKALDEFMDEDFKITEGEGTINNE